MVELFLDSISNLSSRFHNSSLSFSFFFSLQKSPQISVLKTKGNYWHSTEGKRLSLRKQTLAESARKIWARNLGMNGTRKWVTSNRYGLARVFHWVNSVWQSSMGTLFSLANQRHSFISLSVGWKLLNSPMVRETLLRAWKWLFNISPPVLLYINSDLWVFGLDKVSRSQCYYVRKEDDLTSN